MPTAPIDRINRAKTKARFFTVSFHGAQQLFNDSSVRINLGIQKMNAITAHRSGLRFHVCIHNTTDDVQLRYAQLKSTKAVIQDT